MAPLHWAAINGRNDIINVLISAKANVNVQTVVSIIAMY